MSNKKYNNHYKKISHNYNNIGKTFRVNDDDLPHTNKGSGKIVNVGVIEQNIKGEMGVVRLTTQEGKNSRSFHGKHRLYKGFKTFFETEFQNKDAIISSDKRLKENPWINNLSQDNIKKY